MNDLQLFLVGVLLASATVAVIQIAIDTIKFFSKKK